MSGNLVLLIHCLDRPGIVATVTEAIRRFGGNIVDLDQHVDAERSVFFLRVAFAPSSDDAAAAALPWPAL